LITEINVFSQAVDDDIDGEDEMMFLFEDYRDDPHREPIMTANQQVYLERSMDLLCKKGIYIFFSYTCNNHM